MTAVQDWVLPPSAGDLRPGRRPRIAAGGREVVNLCTETDLGLGVHPEVVTARAAARGRPPGEPNARLAAHLAAIKGAAGAVLFPSAAEALRAALDLATAAPGSTMLVDAGCRPTVRAGASADAGTYPHRDVGTLAARLVDEGAVPGRVVLTEGVFGQTGTVAPLAELSAAARAHGVITVLEDTYGLGALGPRGNGSPGHFGQPGSCDLEVASLDGALGASGGAVVAVRDPALLERWREPPSSTERAPLSAEEAAATLAALEVLEHDVICLERVWARTRYLREGLNACFLDTGDTHSPITPVLCGPPEQALAIADRLLAAGVLVAVVPEPVFPGGQAGLRATVSAVHEEDDLEEAIEIILKVSQDVGLIPRGTG